MLIPPGLVWWAGLCAAHRVLGRSEKPSWRAVPSPLRQAAPDLGCSFLRTAPKSTVLSKPRGRGGRHSPKLGSVSRRSSCSPPTGARHRGPSWPSACSTPSSRKPQPPAPHEDAPSILQTMASWGQTEEKPRVSPLSLPIYYHSYVCLPEFEKYV